MLKGKSAIVTGSTSGIGKGIATSLAEAGCHVMLNGFGAQDEIDALQKNLAARHVKVAYSSADMTKSYQISQMIKDAEAAFGQVDILVNNAGIQHVARIEDFPPEKWDAVIAINLTSAFHAIRCAVAGMKARKWGRIINVASAHGLVASVNKSAYVASKHGLVGLTKVVALETAGTGVTCNAVCPGFVLTPLVEKQIYAKAEQGKKTFDEAKRELLAEKQPMGEFVQVEELGALVAFLCGDAAKTMTGSVVSMDGGWTSQ